jgi:hypothetical protein
LSSGVPTASVIRSFHREKNPVGLLWVTVNHGHRSYGLILVPHNQICIPNSACEYRVLDTSRHNEQLQTTAVFKRAIITAISIKAVSTLACDTTVEHDSRYSGTAPAASCLSFIAGYHLQAFRTGHLVAGLLNILLISKGGLIFACSSMSIFTAVQSGIPI